MVSDKQHIEIQQYCPTSTHERNLHGVLPRDRHTDFMRLTVHGECCYCHQRVWAYENSRDPWRTAAIIIEEEPY